MSEQGSGFGGGLFSGLGLELWTLSVLGKYSTTELFLQLSRPKRALPLQSKMAGNPPASSSTLEVLGLHSVLLYLEGTLFF